MMQRRTLAACLCTPGQQCTSRLLHCSSMNHPVITAVGLQLCMLNQTQVMVVPAPFCLRRLALVAAFLVSPFGAAERTWKPFNPLLGETFEMEGVGNGVRFLAEQVRILQTSVLLAPAPFVTLMFESGEGLFFSVALEWQGRLLVRVNNAMSARAHGGQLNQQLGSSR